MPSCILPVLARMSAIVCVLLSLTSAQDIGELYPYGSSQQDKTLAAGNNLTSEPIPLSTPLRFYNVSYETLYVNTNGAISLNAPLSEPLTETSMNSFPLPQDWSGTNREDVMIAPFWADVDTTSDRGDIYFRHSMNPAILEKVTADVHKLFPLHANYSAVSAFVATWSDVSFFDHDTQVSEDPRNTFQVVITTDGSRSFALYRYETIEWAAGSILSNDPERGITSIPALQAVVGFNKGDGLKGYQVDNMVNVTKLPESSNVGVAGLYAFQIDTDIMSATEPPTTEKSKSTEPASVTPKDMKDSITKEPDDGPSNLAWIIPVVIVCVLAVIGVGIFLWRRMQNRKRTHKKDSKGGYSTVQSGSDTKVYNPTTEEIA